MDQPASKGYLYTYHMGFADCDPAGIAYTGALVNAALRAMDRFLSDVTGGRGWFAMSMQMDLAFPFVHLAADFTAPVHGDDDLDLIITVTRLGETSCGLRVTAWQAQRQCFTLDSVSVMIAKGGGKQPMPDWLRSALATYRA